VTKAGIVWSAGSGDAGIAVDIEIDGSRLWSAYLPEPVAGEHRLAWPRALGPYLRGTGGVAVRVAADGSPIAAGTYRLRPERTGRSLRSLVASSMLVDKWGKLVSVANEELHRVLLDGAERVIAELRDGGYTVAITGGTLLGAVRVGTILDRDDDADLLLYLGEATPTDVSIASYRVERLLAAHGHQIIRHSDAHLQVMLAQTESGISAHVDVFFGYHDRGVYSQPIHVRADLPAEALLPLTEIELGGRMFPSVADPEAWLASCYGPGWRVPDPAFSFETPIATRRRFENWFGTYDFTRHFWEAQARTAAKQSAARGKDDVRLMLRRTRRGDAVLDLGAGIGAQSRTLAKHGRVVTAVDFASTAVEAARATSAGRFDVERINFADGHAVLELIERHGGRGDLNVLLGDVLAYLPKDSRSNVFRLVQSLVGATGTVVASFPDRVSKRYEHLRPDTWHLPLSWLHDELAPFGLEHTLIRRAVRRTAVGPRRIVQVSIRATAPHRRQETLMTRIRKAVSAHRTEATEAVEVDRVADLEVAVRELRGEIDELRKDSRRIAELYDLVVEHLGTSRSRD
jgi:SAM-dependent methyltransferase